MSFNLNTDIQIPELVKNGEHEVGLSVSGDGSLDFNHKLFVCKKHTTSINNIALALSHIDHGNGVSAELKVTLDAAIVYIVTRSLFGKITGPMGDIRVVDDIPPGIHIAGVEQRMVAAIGLMGGNEGIITAMLPVIAAKINWFQTNHHTGTPDRRGYVGKVASVLFKNAANNAYYSALHNVAHFVCTKHWMSSVFPNFPINERLDRTATRNFPKLSADAMLRVQGLPAGCAKAGLVLAVGRRAKNSYYGYCFSLLDQVASVREGIQDALAEPWRYHVGAIYLCGNKTELNISEELLAECSAFVHFNMAKTTLAKSTAVMSKDESYIIAGNMVNAMRTVQNALLTASKNATENLIRLVENIGDLSVNPFADF